MLARQASVQIDLTSSMLSISVNKSAHKFELLSVTPMDIARQMTLLEFKLFRQVNCMDLISQHSRLVNKNLLFYFQFSHRKDS